MEVIDLLKARMMMDLSKVKIDFGVMYDISE